MIEGFRVRALYLRASSIRPLVCRYGMPLLEFAPCSIYGQGSGVLMVKVVESHCNSTLMQKSGPGFRVEDFGLTWDDTIWHVLHPPSFAALQTARVWSY